MTEASSTLLSGQWYLRTWKDTYFDRVTTYTKILPNVQPWTRSSEVCVCMYVCVLCVCALVCVCVSCKGLSHLVHISDNRLCVCAFACVWICVCTCVCPRVQHGCVAGLTWYSSLPLPPVSALQCTVKDCFSRTDMSFGCSVKMMLPSSVAGVGSAPTYIHMYVALHNQHHPLTTRHAKSKSWTRT